MDFVMVAAVDTDASPRRRTRSKLTPKTDSSGKQLEGGDRG